MLRELRQLTLMCNNWREPILQCSLFHHEWHHCKQSWNLEPPVIGVDGAVTTWQNAIQVICHTCGKQGHIAKVCKSKEKFRNIKQPVTGSHPKQANLVQLIQPDDSTDESDIGFPVLKVSSEARSAHPITVDMVVNGKTLSMELDMGAAVSIISEQTRKAAPFRIPPLRKSTSVLWTYTGEPMTVGGRNGGSGELWSSIT